MATTRQWDRDFLTSVISSTLLEEAIEWIASNMSPEDVFSDDDLETWAIDSNFTKEEQP